MAFSTLYFGIHCPIGKAFGIALEKVLFHVILCGIIPG